MFTSAYSYVFGIVVLSVLIFAFWKGDDNERSGIVAYTIAWFASMLVQDDTGLYSIQWATFGIDLIILLVFAGLAWKSTRTWPVWAAGFQMFAVLGHVVVMIGLRPPSYSFYTVLAMAAYGVLGAIAVGTFWAWQERVAQEGR